MRLLRLCRSLSLLVPALSLGGPRPMVWVAGEALIDLLPPASPGEEGRAVVGGGAANTAKCLGMLGVPTKFVGGLSTSDEFGRLIEEELQASGVLLDGAGRLSKGTCLAKVTLDEEGRAEYAFILENTATFDFNEQWLPQTTEPPSLLHTGTLATIIEPGASVLFHWARRLHDLGVPIVYDPNVRPAVLPDRDAYRLSVERWLGLAALVKASEDDLQWLYPGVATDEVLHEWTRRGVTLGVVTRGDRGLAAVSDNGLTVEVEARSIEVADTVGAGDTVGAVLCEGILIHGLNKLATDEDILRAVLQRANLAASITCSRFGCKPPSLLDLQVEV